MKKFMLSVLSFAFVVAAAIGIVGCTAAHTHAFNEQKAEAKYLATSATCTEKATDYYSCACGEKGTETFDYGKSYGHAYSEK